MIHCAGAYHRGNGIFKGVFHANQLALLRVVSDVPAGLAVPAQSFNGTVGGTVIDPMGGVLSNTKIMLVNENTNETRVLLDERQADVGTSTFAADARVIQFSLKLLF